jgi:hypothetical protein
MIKDLLYYLFLAFAAYILYTRFWVVRSSQNFYKKQGVSFHNGIVPFFGSFIKMAQYAKKVDVHPLVDLTYNMYYKECIENKKNVPAFVGIAG